MSRRTTISTQRAHALLLDANVIATLLEPAIRNLDLGQNGYPTSTQGASQPTGGGTPEIDDTGARVISTSTERDALRHDPARHDLDELHEHLRLAQHHTARAAHLVTAWGNKGLDRTTISKRLAAVDAGIWCTNCISHGHHTPKATKGAVCEFCAGFRSDWKRLPSKRILDVRSARGGRIYVTDIKRIHDDEDSKRTTKAKAKVAG